MRSVLTVPVIVSRFVEKAPLSGADVVCLDLEDSVPPVEKESARALARRAIEDLRGSDRYALYVRVNGAATGLMEGDLDAVVHPGLDGVIVSMTDSPEVVERVEAAIASLERSRGIEAGSVAIAPLIETAAGIMYAREICAASDRLSGAVFGAEDYATDMGIQRTADGEEIRYARTHVAIACHAVRIVPIDTPDPDYTDEARLEREMQFARSLGYRGKLVIHPTQIAIANRVFCPTESEVSEARRIVDEFEREGLAKGRAAIPLDGRMVDTPIYWRAKHLLDWAEATEN
jgi:citrate lyase subunit beta/citryl-CoA lyase